MISQFFGSERHSVESLMALHPALVFRHFNLYCFILLTFYPISFLTNFFIINYLNVLVDFI